MSFDPHRDRQVPLVPDSLYPPGSIGMADARLAAWAFALGVRRLDGVPSRPTRRGNLPDVDFSAVVVVPRRSLWSRIAGLFRSGTLGAGADSAQRPPQAHNVIPFRRVA